MPVLKVGVGRKTIRFTAYCNDDVLGIAYCLFALEKIKDQFPVTDEEVKQYLINKDPAWKNVFEYIEQGGKLEKFPPYSVDPQNASHEARILFDMYQERLAQGRIG